MKISRRRFLTAGSWLALGIAAPRFGWARLLEPAAGPDGLTRSRFARCLDTVFRVRDHDVGTLSLRLAEIGAVRGGDEASRERCFSLLFRGPAGPRLSQGIHRFDHFEMGSFDLFIVPVGRVSAAGATYQAVFCTRADVPTTSPRRPLAHGASALAGEARRG